MRLLYFICLSVLCLQTVTAQPDSVLLTDDYRFKDGVYFGFRELCAGQPEIPVDQLEGRIVTNAETLITKSDYLAVKSDTGVVAIDLDRIWALCLDGLVYLPVPVQDHAFAAFAQLRTVGRLGYFEFEEKVDHKVTITAYNPLTKMPFRSADLSRPKWETQTRVLDFTTGKISPADAGNLKRLTAGDAELQKVLTNNTQALTPEAGYRLIAAFNKRNALYLPR